MFTSKKKVYELRFDGKHLFDVIDVLSRNRIGDHVNYEDSVYGIGNAWNYIRLSATAREMARAQRLFTGMAKIVAIN